MPVFLVIALVGFLLLAISFFFGAEHEIGGHDFSLEHGIDHDHDMHGHDAQSGPSPFSFRIITLFLTSFGAAGAIGRYIGLGFPLSSMIGLGCGFGMGAIGFRTIKLFWNQQATSSIGGDDIVGVIGEVKTAIPANGVGEIGIIVKGQRIYRSARSSNHEEAIQEGSLVRVVAYPSDALIVEKTT